MRQQAGRCLGRALSDLIALHYPDFFLHVETDLESRQPRHKQDKPTKDAASWKYAFYDIPDDKLKASRRSCLPSLPATLTLFGEIKVALNLTDRWLLKKK